MLELPFKMKKIPWEDWNHDSKMGEYMSSWGHGCDCQLPEVDWNLIMYTSLVFIRAIACPMLDQCRIIDYWRWLHDVHHIR